MTPIRMPGTKPQATMIDDDGDQRQIFELRKPLARFDDPFVQLVGAEIEQQAAEHEFGNEAEQLGRDGEHQQRQRRGGEAGQPPAAAAGEIEDRAADRAAAGIAAEHAGEDVGRAGDVQLALQIGFAVRWRPRCRWC